MLESLKYAVACAWYIFLFIPLFMVILIVICLGAAAIYAMFCNWIVPSTNNMKKNIALTKRTMEEEE